MNVRTASKPLVIGLWTAQVIIAALFCLFGYMKFTMPIEALVAMQIHWAADLPEWQVRTMGVIDLAGGIGILLPALTKIRPQLSVLAAAGCTLLQICAMIFHLSRGEGNVVGLNIVLLALSAFVLWGRATKAPFATR